jgi:hypothetical protein
MIQRSRRVRRARASTPTVSIAQWHNPKPEDNTTPMLIGTPSLGLIRLEWANAMDGMVKPPNWSVAKSSPIGYPVGPAQNMIVDTVLRGPFRALLLIEDDTVPPLDALLLFDRWFFKMERKLAPPIVSGVYHIKGSEEIRRGKTGGIATLGAEPLIYRGGGMRAYRDFMYGDVVWCNGIPTGALMIHRSVLEAWAREPDVPSDTIPGYPHPCKRVFEQPSRVWQEPGGAFRCMTGTTDLYWSEQTIRRDILTKAGYGKYAKREFPYIVDTALRFGHIDRATGVITTGLPNGMRADGRPSRKLLTKAA